ncbi:MAG: ferrochelatase [Syntrophotaleaceae bacterium]
MSEPFTNRKVHAGPLHSDRRTAVVLLNMGGPDSLEAVEPFLYNLFSDRRLIALPGGPFLQKPFARMISRRRARSARENYRHIGGRSPLLDWTERQALGLSRVLDSTWGIYVIMRYWQPRAQEVLWRMRNDQVEQALVLPLYPQYAEATTGSSIADFRQAAATLFPELTYAVIDHWYDWAPYLDALAARVVEGLESFPRDMRDEVPLLFSAHSLPQRVIDRGDPFLGQTLATVRGVMQRIGDRPWHVGFQSRSGPVKWLRPSVDEVIKTLAAKGHKSLLMVPLSFVSDHIETLHEIDVIYRRAATERGIVHFVRSPSLNDHPDFLQALAMLLQRRYNDLCEPDDTA